MKKRSDGRYQLSVMIGYKEDGYPKRKVVYGRTQREVLDKANDIRKQHYMGLLIDNKVTVIEWAEIWLYTYKSGLSYNTQRIYQGIIDTYINPNLGDFKLADVKTAHLQKIVNDNADKTRTTELFKLTISQMFNQAIINDLLVKNPALGINLPKPVKKVNKRALTDDETQRIKTLDLDEKTKCFINLLMYTGMRRGEALAVTKNDIDFEKKEISVDKTLIFKKNQSEIKPNPKTPAGTRTIPLLAPLENILSEYIKSTSANHLFMTRDGNTMSITAYRRMWQRFEKAIGTKDITAHIFRHNFATILYNAGVDVKTAQVILGHSSISVTMDIYTHLSNKNKEEATNKLNDFLK